MACVDLYAIFGIISLTPHHLPHSILTDTQPLRGVLNRVEFGVDLPYSLLEFRTTTT